MASKPKKSLAEYIHQGDLIQLADDAALAVPEIWALVPAIRTRLDDRLATLHERTTTAETIAPAYDLKVEEKDGYDVDAEETCGKLAVYIENAFPDDAEQINHTLLLDKEYPSDDEEAKQYLISVLDALSNHDNVTYPLPATFTDPLTTAANNFITALAEVVDLFEDRRTAIQDRDIALEQFIEVLSPIRKWLWKMLPEGRYDTRLIDYGFTPYGTHHGDTGDGGEQLPTPENFGLEFLDPDLRIFWDAVEGATSYHLEMGNNPTILGTNLYDGTDTEFTFDPPGGHLYFRVWAMKGEEWGERGEAIDIEVEGTPPGPPGRWA